MRTTIADEYGKLNLNALIMREGEVESETGADTEGEGGARQWLVDILINFFRYRSPDSAEPPEAIVDAILDWLDFDDGDQERPEGAEKDYYEGLEIPYAIKNGPMSSIEELLLIKGMTPELYYGNPEEEQLPLSEYLTVHGDTQGRININTAPLELLQSVFEVTGGDPAVADEVYETVRVEQPYTDVGQVQGLLPEAEPDPAQSQRERRRQERAQVEQGLEPGQQQGLTSQIFRVSSNVFRIYGDGMQGDTLVRIIAYVYRNGGGDPGGGADASPPPEEPFRVLSWSVIR
jgi:type II secretory pathway component PulK